MMTMKNEWNKLERMNGNFMELLIASAIILYSIGCCLAWWMSWGYWSDIYSSVYMKTSYLNDLAIRDANQVCVFSWIAVIEYL